MSPISVMKGLMMGEKRLLNGMRRGVLSTLSFTDRDGVRYFDQAWLRKSTNIIRRRQRNVASRKKDFEGRGENYVKSRRYEVWSD